MQVRRCSQYPERVGRSEAEPPTFRFSVEIAWHSRNAADQRLLTSWIIAHGEMGTYWAQRMLPRSYLILSLRADAHGWLGVHGVSGAPTPSQT
jgi:hypothetical protein